MPNGQSTVYLKVISMKDEAIVLAEAREIIEVLPVESQSDIELAKAIVGSLQAGQDPHEVEIKAIKIAHQRLESKVNKGFELVAKDLQTIKHEAEKDRIHAQYARQDAQEAKAEVSQLWRSLFEVQTISKVAEAKAEGAKETAKNSRWTNFDPLTGMTVCAIGIVALLALFANVRVENNKPAPPSRNIDLLTCGVEVTCIPNQPRQPIPNRGGV